MIGGIKTAAGTDREIAIPQKIKPIVSRLHSASKAEFVPIGKVVLYKNFLEALERAGIRRLTPIAAATRSRRLPPAQGFNRK